jgi:hypothetical protein
MHDQGSEFVGHCFQTMLDERNVVHRPTTVKNPQANAICERLHQTAGNASRVLIHAHPPQNVNNAAFLIDTALSTAACLARASIHSALKISPGALVFHRDMTLDVPVIADLHLLQQQRQALIDKNLLRANRRRVLHDCQPTDKVSLLTHEPDKLDPQAAGPCTVHSVHANGTVTVNRNPSVREGHDTRRPRPHHRDQVSKSNQRFRTTNANKQKICPLPRIMDTCKQTQTNESSLSFTFSSPKRHQTRFHPPKRFLRLIFFPFYFTKAMTYCPNTGQNALLRPFPCESRIEPVEPIDYLCQDHSLVNHG